MRANAATGKESASIGYEVCTLDRAEPWLQRNPELMAALLDNPEGASPGQLILALKALRTHAR